MTFLRRTKASAALRWTAVPLTIASARNVSIERSCGKFFICEPNIYAASSLRSSVDSMSMKTFGTKVGVT
jgi:hypothetical protein